MGDYMKEVLRPTGVSTLEELIKDEKFIEYCKRFDGDDIMNNFRDKVESYIGYKIKEIRKNEN